jgi:hypothetical protein
MAEEAPQQLGVAGETSSFAAHAGLDLIGRVRGEVRQPPVLEIAPEEFHGVEIGRVGRKPHDVAARMSDQPRADEGGLVRAAAIPEQDERTTDVAGQMAQKPQDLRTPDVAARVQG